MVSLLQPDKFNWFKESNPSRDSGNEERLEQPDKFRFSKSFSLPRLSGNVLN